MSWLPWLVEEKIFKFLEPRSDEKIYFAIVFEKWKYLANPDVMMQTSSSIAFFIGQNQELPEEIRNLYQTHHTVLCTNLLNSIGME